MALAAGRLPVVDDLFLLLRDAALDLLPDPLVEPHRLVVDARRDRLPGVLEVLHEHLLGLHVLAEGGHRRLPAQSLDVRARVPVEVDREGLDVYVLVQGHRLRVDLQDLEPRLLVGHGHEDEAIEPARAQEPGVDHVRPVRRPDHDDALHALQPVHGGEELVHDALRDALVVPSAPTVRDAVELVEEHDARRDLFRLLEDHPDGLLGLADPLRHDLGALDRDEVRLALVRDGLRQEGLPGPRGPVEQDSARRVDAHARERLRLLERELDGLPESHLHVLEPADILPRDAGNLDKDLAHRARLDLLQRVLEVLLQHAHALEGLGRHGPLEVHLRQVPPERLHRGLPAQRRQVRAHEPVCDVRELRQETVLVLLRALDRHPARVDLQDLLATLAVRDANLDLSVEPTGAAERRVDRLLAVRRPDHDDLAAPLESVHEGQELRDDAPLDLARDLFPLGRDRIELVDEQHGGGVLLRLLEFLAEALLALPVILRHDLGALDRVEIRTGLVRDRLRDQRLPRPW